jgi:hypothetical protein
MGVERIGAVVVCLEKVVKRDAEPLEDEAAVFLCGEEREGGREGGKVVSLQSIRR